VILHEFAVDPGLFGTLHDFNLWSHSFGISCGRLIAKYPENWKTIAFKSISEHKPKARKELVEKIRRLDERTKVLDLKREPYESGPWIDNARKQHQRRPFHAIIAAKNPAGYPDVLVGDDIDDETPEFKVSPGAIVPRVARDMADAVATLLYKASKVMLVDPHFHPAQDRFLRPLHEFLKRASLGVALQEVEYHLFCDPVQMSGAEFARACRYALADYIPKGVSVRFVRWNKKSLSGQDGLHPRYILTDIAGVRFDWGLDEGTGQYAGTTCDVEVLSENIYRQRMREYDKSATTFCFEDEAVIVGTDNMP